jgi:hypothetical protein
MATKDSRVGVEAQALTGGNPLTVTQANPTPPTNFSYNVYGTPPTPASMVPVDDGTPVATTVIATPLSVVAPQGVVAEATGTVVIDTKPGETSITVQGAYSSTPNANHPSSQAPATPPTITGLVPATTQGSGGTMNLTVNGTGFEQASVVNVGGVPNTTNYISPTQLQAINAPKRTSAGTTPITVVTNGVATAATNWTFT